MSNYVYINDFMFRKEDTEDIFNLYSDLYPDISFSELQRRVEGCLMANLESWCIGAVKSNDKQKG